MEALLGCSGGAQRSLETVQDLLIPRSQRRRRAAPYDRTTFPELYTSVPDAATKAFASSTVANEYTLTSSVVVSWMQPNCCDS